MTQHEIATWGMNMKAFRMPALVLSALLSLTAGAQSDHVAAPSPRVDPLPRDLEIQLAMSALPRHLRDHATVYALNPAKGFEVARTGTNGFHALVARTGDDAFRGSWPLTKYREDILYPISFDEAGARANMRVFFDAAQMQAAGTPAPELKKIIQDRYKAGHYKAPERAGVSYMMSPILRTYTNPDQDETVHTASIPHVMYYAPNTSNEAVGGATPTTEQFRHLIEHGRWPDNPDPFVILHGVHGYTIQFLGVTERAAVNKEYEALLGRLCKIKDMWCLPE
jgi:hypothetical protein